MSDKDLIKLIVEDLSDEQATKVIDYITELVSDDGESCESCKV